MHDVLAIFAHKCPFEVVQGLDLLSLSICHLPVEQLGAEEVQLGRQDVVHHLFYSKLCLSSAITWQTGAIL